MLKALKYRLYPSEDQEILLNKHFGAMRLVYNLALGVKIEAYRTQRKNVGYHELATEQLKDLKEGYDFFKEVNSQALQTSLRNLDVAYKKFFSGLSKFPKFKKKTSRQSFTCPQNFSIEKGKLFLPKFKDGIDIVLHRALKGVTRSVTLSKTATGKYFASILCETMEVKKPKLPITEKTSVGIDLGLKSFIFCSDGFSVKTPKYLRESEQKVKYFSHELARKKKGSKRREEARFKLAKVHERIGNQRKDFLHKASSVIAKRFDTVCFETLKVDNMLKNHCLAKSIADASWSEFVRMVEYKLEWKGGSVLRIGTFEPSSKVCSVCFSLKKDLTLDVREWTCAVCGTHHERDENAANVIKVKCLNNVLGLSERQCQDVEVSPLQCKRAVEASKILSDMPCKRASYLDLEAPCL